MDDVQSAELRTDYRIFRFLTRLGAQLTVAGLIFSAWHILWDRTSIRLDGASPTLIFLLSTTAQALALSLVAGMVSYMLFKRRGGKIEKTPPPPM